MTERKAVLVTGGAGYVGAHACKALSNAGWLPIVYDDLRRGAREAVRWGPLIEADIADAAALGAAFSTYAPVAVMHFAAYAYVGESTLVPELYYANNVAGASAVFAAAARSGAPIIFSSTCSTYGEKAPPPITEDAPRDPVNPYGRSKLMAEAALADIAAAHGGRYAVLRYFNAAGADPEGEIGERHDPETHLLPLAIEAAIGGAPLTVFGDDYPTPDGSAVRDYVHVADLADAHLRALDRMLGGGDPVTVNLGAGVGSSVFQVIDAVEAAVGTRPKYKVGPRRLGDPAALFADASLARALLGWRAERDLRQCADDAVAWRCTHGRRFFSQSM